MSTLFIDLVKYARLQKQKRKTVAISAVRELRLRLLQQSEIQGRRVGEFYKPSFVEDQRPEAFATAYHLAIDLCYDAIMRTGILNFAWDPKILSHRLIMVSVLKGPAYVNLTAKQEESVTSDLVELLSKLQAGLIEEELKTGGISDETRHKAGAFAEIVIEDFSHLYVPYYARVSKLALEILSYLFPVAGSEGRVEKYVGHHGRTKQTRPPRVQPIAPSLKVWSSLKERIVADAANEYEVDLRTKKGQ